MGNNSSKTYSERFPLDDSSMAVLRKTKRRTWREDVDTWNAQYFSLGRTTCELDLTKTNNLNNHEQELCISINDHAPNHANDHVDFKMSMSVEEGLLLANVNLNGPKCMQQLRERKAPMAQGGVLKSSSFLYGRDTDRKGLIVILRAKKNDNDEELPYMITVKHYFVAASCSHGVSVVAKIRSDSGEGGLSVEVEKPCIESKRSLLSMFDDVKGKGWWPSSADSAIGNCFGGKNNNPANANCYSISGQQNMSSLVSTSGYTFGDYNGSIILQDCLVRFSDGKEWRPNRSTSGWPIKLPNQNQNPASPYNFINYRDWY